MNIKDIIFSKSHLNAPFTMPGSARNSPAQFATMEKATSVAISILIGVFTAGIGGVITFYLITAAMKAKKLNNNIPLPSQKNTNKVGSNTLVRSPNWSDIENLTANKVGQLVDQQYDDLKGNKLTRDELQSNLNLLIREERRYEKISKDITTRSEAEKNIDPFSTQIFKEQGVGMGMCGYYAFNNAYGKCEINEGEYREWVKKWLVENSGFDQEGVNELSEQDLDTPPEAFCHFLESQKIIEKDAKFMKISDLEDFQEDKGKALKDYIGEAERFWIANITDGNIYVPSRNGGVNPIAVGHIVCARKDKNDQWWLIDSRRSRKVPLKFLTILHKDLSIIV